MHETDVPESVEPVSESAASDPSDGDAALDEVETDLDHVSAALDALDTDDLDAAEALVAGLVESDPGSDTASS